MPLPRMPSDFRALILHCFWSTVLALVIFAAATGLTYVEDWLHENGRPQWLEVGVATVSIALFVVDGIVVVGAAAIAGGRTLRALARK